MVVERPSGKVVVADLTSAREEFGRDTGAEQVGALFLEAVQLSMMRLAETPVASSDLPGPGYGADGTGTCPGPARAVRVSASRWPALLMPGCGTTSKAPRQMPPGNLLGTVSGAAGEDAYRSGGNRGTTNLTLPLQQ